MMISFDLILIVVFALLIPQSTAVTHLFQNNLNFTEDGNHNSFLLVELNNQTKIQNVCSQFMEKPVTVEKAQRDISDLTKLIKYQIYSGQISATSHSIQLSDGEVNLTHNSTILQINKNKPSAQHGLALCTQSDTQVTTTDSVPTTTNMLNVTIPQSQNIYTGYRNKKSFRFLGIPYSNDPARWKYAELNTRTHSYFNATSFGSICPQSGSNNTDENCLFLNIWTNYLPSSDSNNKKKLKPILFWIHGGAFTGGSGSDSTFDGGNLVSRGDVVLITINYRLANLGFLNVPGTNITGNYGFADQIIALQWVKNNIKAFGGDPNRVTIWGQSAGAASVRALLGSPKSRNLFAAAIVGSNLGGYDYGTTYSEYYTAQQSYDVIGNATVTAAGCNDNKFAVYHCLEQISAYDLQNTLPNKIPANGNSARFLIVDGKYLTEPRLNVTDPNKVANVPTLWGNMAEDGAAFLQFTDSGINRTTAIDSVLNNNQALYAKAAYSEQDLFPLGTSLTNNASLNAFNLSAQIGTDVIFRCLDQATVSTALKYKSLSKAWYYQFQRSYQPGGYDPNAPVCDAPKTVNKPNGDPNLPYLRCHSGDLLFEFGNYANGNVVFRDQNDLPFTSLIMDYWTAFARNHDPNPSLGYLTTRGYKSTLQTIQKTKNWQESHSQSTNVRLLDVIPRQLNTSIRSKQCKIEGIPSE